jgi:hypothetical protein
MVLSGGVMFSLILFLQDIWYRYISIPPLALFFICGLLLTSDILKAGIKTEWLINTAVVSILFLVLLIYNYVRERNFHTLFKKIGTGDLLMMFAAGFWLGFPMFLFWLISINILLLAGIVVFKPAHPAQGAYRVPLAGWMAITIPPTWAIGNFVFNPFLNFFP